MAITDDQKLDLLFKKIGFGVAKTDTSTNKAAFNEAIPSPLLMRGDQVWNQADQIPGTKPSASNDYVTVYDYLETTEDITSSNNRTWKTNLNSWIPVEFGATYQVVVYAAPSGTADPSSSGTRLFGGGAGNNDEWYFDYSAGVLNFIGTNLPTAIGTGTNNVIYISGARYTGTLGVGNLEVQAALASNVANLVDSDLTSTSIDQTIDSFHMDSARTCKYLIQLEHDSDFKFHSTEILLTHNNEEVFFTEYAIVQAQDSSLGEFFAEIDGNNINLTVTPAYTNTSIKAKRFSIIDDYEADYTINVTASGGAYILSGTDRNGSVSGSQPSLAFNTGDKVQFRLDTSTATNHPFYIKTQQGTGTGNQADNVSGAGKLTVRWNVTSAGTYYYQCQYHNSMYGIINVS
jgi:plastocyanin